MSWRLLVPLLNARLPEGVSSWFAEALGLVEKAGVESDVFAARWSGLGRRFGRGTVSLTGDEAGALRAGGAVLIPEGWGMDEAGRAVLLLAAWGATPVGRQVAVVGELFRAGEIREQQAVVKSLTYLPEPARFAATAVEAVRNNSLSVLEAVACENPYAAAHVAEELFNQMVVKALFNGIALARIVGLADRRTPELVRMVKGFVSERQAAGRTVPSDVTFITEGSSHAAV